MKKIIVLSIMAFVLSPLNPIFHVAKASVVLEAAFEAVVDAEGPCLNCNNEGSVEPIDEEAVPTPDPVAPPCPGPAFSGDSVISLILPCPIGPNPKHDFDDAMAVDDIIPAPAPAPCVTHLIGHVPGPSVVLPCPIGPNPKHDFDDAMAVDDIIPAPAPAPCVTHLIGHVPGPSVVLPCPIGPNPKHDFDDAMAVDDIIPAPAPIPLPCPIGTIISVDTIVVPGPIQINPCVIPAHDPADEEEEVITPPNPPAGGGGGGISIFQTDVLGNTPPAPVTTPDQQVLGEQVFSDGSPSQQVLGEKKFASVLGEKVTAPSFPKTGTGSDTTNSIVWQLVASLLLSSVLAVSLIQKKTLLASK
jgi:hypothetical protein